MKKYKVEFMKDYTYEVFEYDYEGNNRESVFQGSISDCEAYIRLYEGGYM